MRATQILGIADFSRVSQPAINYAAQLAQSLHATLTLAALQSPCGVNHNSTTKDSPLADQVITLCKKIAFTHHIGCSFDNGLVGVTRSEALQLSTKNYQMVILGMNEVDDYVSFFSDRTILATLAQMKSQVLLIPLMYHYLPITRIAFCFELDKDEDLFINPLLELAKVLKCKIYLLQLVRDKFSRGLETAILRQQEQMRQHYHNQIPLDFKTTWTTEFAGSANFFMQSIKADVLALCAKRPSFLQELFQRSSTSDLASIAHYPLILI